MSDALVIGAGIAGLAAALRLRQQGASVTLATFGTGGLPLSVGGIEVLGRIAARRVENPLEGWDELPAEHPYRVIGDENVKAGVEWFCELLGPQLMGMPTWQNLHTPTALGALRRSAALPPGLAAGTGVADRRTLVVGIGEFKDFHADHCAGNLAAHGCRVSHVEVGFEARPGEADPSGLAIANALDEPAARERLACAIRPHLDDAELVLLPAVVGHRDPSARSHLAELLGVEIAEVSCLPPSVPGIRLNDHLVTAAKQARVRWILGSRVIGGQFEGNRLTAVTLATTGHPTTLRADHVVLATGGFESGALELDSWGELHESTLGLPVWRPEGELVGPDYLGVDQPLFRAGLRVDEAMRPLALDESGRPTRPVAENLHAIGGLLAGAVRWTEGSGEGIALGSAWAATTAILEEMR